MLPFICRPCFLSSTMVSSNQRTAILTLVGVFCSLAPLRTTPFSFFSLPCATPASSRLFSLPWRSSLKRKSVYIRHYIVVGMGNTCGFGRNCPSLVFVAGLRGRPTLFRWRRLRIRKVTTPPVLQNPSSPVTPGVGRAARGNQVGTPVFPGVSLISIRCVTGGLSLAILVTTERCGGRDGLWCIMYSGLPGSAWVICNLLLFGFGLVRELRPSGTVSTR